MESYTDKELGGAALEKVPWCGYSSWISQSERGNYLGKFIKFES